MKTYTQGLYEGLKLALKIVKTYDKKEIIEQDIKKHMLLLDTDTFIKEDLRKDY